MNHKIATCFLLLILFIAGCENEKINSDTDLISEVEKQYILPKEYEKGWIRIKFNHLDKDLNTTPTRSGTINTGIPEIYEPLHWALQKWNGFSMKEVNSKNDAKNTGYISGMIFILLNNNL